MEVEKNCELEAISAVELLASKFLSLIGKSTEDYELKKKIRKSDMPVEAIKKAIHEYMYENLNESPETEKEKKIRHVEKIKFKYTKVTNRRYPKARRLDGNRTDVEHPAGPNNMTVLTTKRNKMW